jgi:hypothetical protein
VKQAEVEAIVAVFRERNAQRNAIFFVASRGHFHWVFSMIHTENWLPQKAEWAAASAAHVETRAIVRSVGMEDGQHLYIRLKLLPQPKVPFFSTLTHLKVGHRHPLAAAPTP